MSEIEKINEISEALTKLNDLLEKTCLAYEKLKQLMG